MKKPAKIILAISIFITLCLILLDYRNDTPPAGNMPGYIAEYIFWGAFYVAFIFGIIYGMHALLMKAIRG